MKLNNWHIEPGFTATFTPDDYRGWWLANQNESDTLTLIDRAELLDNCVYLARAEGREMTQQLEELRAAIDRWADEWNSSRA